MPAITPEFMFDFESNMQAITENEYARMTANLWWQKFMKVRPSSSKREIIAWLLSTAMIEDQGKGGNIMFDDIVSQTTEFVNKDAGAGLKMRKQQIEDLDGNGLDVAAKWSGDIGAYMAYWPQKKLAYMLMNGHDSAVVKAYDGKAFFATDHPLNPYDAGAGDYSNLFTGSDAAPIDASVTLEAAFNNFAKVVALIKKIKQANGEDPRFLVPRFLVVPPKLQTRATLITQAKFIAQASEDGGGSADVSAVVAGWKMDAPIVADELSGFESETSYFVGCEQMNASQLGAFVYCDREPFKITYYTGSGGGTGVDAVLDRAQQLEWHCHGRNVAGPGHPYLFFKVKAS